MADEVKQSEPLTTGTWVNESAPDTQKGPYTPSDLLVATENPMFPAFPSTNGEDPPAPGFVATVAGDCYPGVTAETKLGAASLEIVGTMEEAMQSAGLEKPKKRFSPVTKIFAMNDYVVMELENGQRVPVRRPEMLMRLNQLSEMLAREDPSKPRDELERECWLIEEGLKACIDSARQMKKEYGAKTRQSMNAFLKNVEKMRKSLRGGS